MTETQLDALKKLVEMTLDEQPRLVVDFNQLAVLRMYIQHLEQEVERLRKSKP